MKDLLLFIRKNLVQFVVLVVIISTAGIMLSNAYVNAPVPTKYYLDTKDLGDGKVLIYIVDDLGGEICLLDNDLFSHMPDNKYTDYNLDRLYDYVQVRFENQDFYELSQDYYMFMERLEKGEVSFE